MNCLPAGRWQTIHIKPYLHLDRYIFSRFHLWHFNVNSFPWAATFVVCWYLCKQFGPKSRPTFCRSWSGSKWFDTLIVFLKEFLEKVNFEKSQQTTTKDYLCKLFGPRSGPAFCWPRSGSKPYDTLIVFLKEGFEKVNFEKSQQKITKDNLCKLFGPRSRPTCRSWSESKLFDALIGFPKEFFKKTYIEKSADDNKNSKYVLLTVLVLPWLSAVPALVYD